MEVQASNLLPPLSTAVNNNMAAVYNTNHADPGGSGNQHRDL